MSPTAHSFCGSFALVLLHVQAWCYTLMICARSRSCKRTLCSCVCLPLAALALYFCLRLWDHCGSLCFCAWLTPACAGLLWLRARRSCEFLLALAHPLLLFCVCRSPGRTICSRVYFICPRADAHKPWVALLLFLLVRSCPRHCWLFLRSRCLRGFPSPPPHTLLVFPCSTHGCLFTTKRNAYSTS